MSLDKAIEHGKEKRKPYQKAKAIDRTCRNHGSCKYCERGRCHKHKKRIVSIKDQLKEMENDKIIEE